MHSARVSSRHAVGDGTRAGASMGAAWLPGARTVLLVALVVGMAASISVTQITLAALAVWLVLARRAGLVPPLQAPLVAPIAAFAAWSVVAALVSDRPLESLVALKSLLDLGALFVIVNALSEPRLARRFATWLLLALTTAGGVGLLQVAVCPGPEVGGLGGVLAMMLTSALPRLARLRADVAWLGPAWVVAAGALALTYVRGAWLGFAAGALTAVAGLGRGGI